MITELTIPLLLTLLGAIIYGIIVYLITKEDLED